MDDPLRAPSSGVSPRMKCPRERVNSSQGCGEGFPGSATRGKHLGIRHSLNSIRARYDVTTFLRSMRDWLCVSRVLDLTLYGDRHWLILILISWEKVIWLVGMIAKVAEEQSVPRSNGRGSHPYDVGTAPTML